MWMILVYGPDGKRIAGDDGEDKAGFDFLYKWMNHEMQRDWEKKRKRS